MKTYRIFDPLYGPTKITEEEYNLILLPEVQRLREIRMCNINSFLITGASEPKRFEHSIGVLRLAKEWCDVNGEKVGTDSSFSLKAAAILHDVLTGPFGHSMEYIFSDNEEVEDFYHEDANYSSEESYYQDLSLGAHYGGRNFEAKAYLGNNWALVADYIKGEGDLGQMISGVMDFDNLDNVIRLAYHCGIAEKSDAQVAINLAKNMGSKNGNLVFPMHQVHEIRRWQYLRSELYKFLLNDWAEFSSKAMLTFSLEEAILRGLLGADSWLFTDSELLRFLEKDVVGDNQDISDLIKRIKLGRLFEPISLIESSEISFYKTLSKIKTKREIEQEANDFVNKKLGLPGHVLFHPILDKNKTDREITFLQKEDLEEVKVGISSSRLLMGLFYSKNISELNRQKLKKFFEGKIKENWGIEFKTIPDPVLSESEQIRYNQLDLFDG